MDRVFQVLAVILVGLAAYFVWNGNNDGAFVSGVLGCVAFFLSIRAQAKVRNRLREEERKAEMEPSPDEPSAGDTKSL